MKSVIQESKERCYMCGAVVGLEEHHIFGASNRKKSEKMGYKVMLCHYCHNEPPQGVHQNRENRNRLKRVAQEHFEATRTREEFIKEFGRNYL